MIKRGDTVIQFKSPCGCGYNVGRIFTIGYFESSRFRCTNCDWVADDLDLCVLEGVIAAPIDCVRKIEGLTPEEIQTEFLQHPYPIHPAQTFNCRCVMSPVTRGKP